MSLDVPVTWLSYEGLPSRGKWDQFALARLLAGEESRPAGAYRFIDTPWTPDDHQGRVIVFPAGSYHDEGVEHRVRPKLVKDLAKLPWALLIATSDECSHFRWELIDPWPTHVKLWVMTPRTGQRYPAGTRFIGEGSPVSALQQHVGAALTRDLDVFFSGQINNERRMLAGPAMRECRERFKSKVITTPSFLHSERGEPVTKPGGDAEYMFDLTRAWVAPAPSGMCTQDSFRFFEALESGCIPIVDELSPLGNRGYWDLLGLADVAPRIEFWRDLPVMAESALTDRCATAAHVSSRWQQYKRRLANQLHDDVESMLGFRHYEPPHDAITVIVVTSPVPSNPDITMIQNVINSVRMDLPGAEILIACDTPHEMVAHRTADYNHFLQRLTFWANAQFNMTVFTTHEHSHESGLLQMVMPHVRTDYVLFVEHDCPLIQPVDFQACLDEMVEYDLRHLRFGHERTVLDEHAYLYPFGVEPAGNHIKTVQYSSRPAIYTTELMNDLLCTYFAQGSTCMIESVLYGPWQHTDAEFKPKDHGGSVYADRMRRQDAWKRYRSALWAPGENLAFSGHLDGRGDDPNVPLHVAYPDGEIPPGAPQPGEMRI